MRGFFNILKNGKTATNAHKRRNGTYSIHNCTYIIQNCTYTTQLNSVCANNNTFLVCAEGNNKTFNIFKHERAEESNKTYERPISSFSLIFLWFLLQLLRNQKGFPLCIRAQFSFILDSQGVQTVENLFLSNVFPFLFENP